MAKLKNPLLVIVALTISMASLAQKAYVVQYTFADSTATAPDLQKEFSNRNTAAEYVTKLPALLQSKGFITSSIDSLRLDSVQGFVYLFLGNQYKWARINTNSKDEDVLQAIRWNEKQIAGNTMNFAAVQSSQERILQYLEENGHPFARISLDSVTINNNEVAAQLKIERGPQYHIDSIRVYGDARISNLFLQQYLDVHNGSIYNKKKLQNISKKLSELSYVQEERPYSMTMLGTGSVLNLYLKNKKSSQVNVLIGVLPNNNASAGKKTQITGDANILLRNSLGAGETIGLNWQQLQVQSPRLNLLYNHPYIFKSPFGLIFLFDMLRKDTTFLNINMRLGASYVASGGQSGFVFLQRRQSIVNGVNLAQVLASKQLPKDADVSSNNLGVSYEFNNTNYRNNPQRGNEFTVTTSAGTKKVRPNNQILELKDPNDPAYNFKNLYDTVKLKTYQFRITTAAAHYFPLGKQSAFKTGISGGIFGSGNIFRNELFQIGGYRLLRGFDEESQFVSQYVVGTLEYRYLVGMNSNFFAFVDGGWAKHPLGEAVNHTYIGTGMGLAFETKAGVFNIVWAIGKRDDTQLNLRQSKVHLGFVNYF
jgi:outer membrane protein assembly factor BamA